VGGAATVEAAVAAARTAARAHPADFVPQATAGARLAEAGRCGEAMPWLTRAMLLDPTAAEPHLHAARCLADAGQDRQARLEWRLAFAFGARQALAEAVARYPAVDDLLQVAPDTPDGLLALGAHLLGRRPTDAVVVYRRALDEYGDGRALVPLAGAVLSTGDAAGALELARRRAREAPHDVVAWRLASQVLVKLGDESGAEEALEQGLALNPGSPPLVAWRAERLIAARRFSQARQVADGMLARTPSEQVQRQLLQARALAGQERWGEAIERARAAVAIMPGTAGPLLALAGLAAQANRFDEAIDAVERAAGLPGQDRAALEQRLAALRAARDRQQERRLLEGR
jgi:Flp pilus assembly protein TadD